MGNNIKCHRDSAELAVQFIRPNNRCGPNGECVSAACMIFNGLTFYPERSSAGFCIQAGGETMGLAYIEKYILAIKEKPWDFVNRWDYIMSSRWAQQDSPEVLSCEFFLHRRSCAKQRYDMVR
jgi:hypothetical protein